MRLGDNTSPVLAKIYQSQLPETTIQQPARQLPAVLNLRGFLKPEIDAGLVAVKDEADRSVVILKGTDSLPRPQRWCAIAMSRSSTASPGR